MNPDYALEVLKKEYQSLRTKEDVEEKEKKLESLAFSIRVLKGYKEGVGRYDSPTLRD